MNPILTQIPKAQEAYNMTLETWESMGVDTAAVLVSAAKNISDAVEKGYLATYIGNIEDMRVAEKAALELQELGYATACISGGQAAQPDGSIRPLSAISVQWKALPANTRDKFTV